MHLRHVTDLTLESEIQLLNFPNKAISITNFDTPISKFIEGSLAVFLKFWLKTLLLQDLSEPGFYSDLGRVVRREQSSSIAIELTFAPPQINKRYIDVKKKRFSHIWHSIFYK